MVIKDGDWSAFILAGEWTIIKLADLALNGKFGALQSSFVSLQFSLLAKAGETSFLKNPELYRKLLFSWTVNELMRKWNRIPVINFLLI